PLTDQDFEKLPAEEQERTRQAMSAISDKLRQHIESVQGLQKERRERIKALNRHVTELTAGPAIDAPEAAYREFPDVLRYLDRVRDDVLMNPQYLAPPEAAQLPFAAAPMPPLPSGARLPGAAAGRVRRYEINVVVDHSDGGLAPIVYEQHPS